MGAQCTCPSGITGTFCETIIDQCQSQPCENNGTCKSLIDKYVCMCPNGFMGSNCQIERNECEPVNPCLNSGRCVDRLNNFTCICNPGKIRMEQSTVVSRELLFRFYGFVL